jgi:6-phosphogluconolactonase/glucosamine-6-phosphate isomerase/deaminase
MKIIKVKNTQEGFEICKKLLYETVSKNSVLFLSGGSTPKTLYQILAKEKTLKVGAVALIDERFGAKLHENSNEKMIHDTGLVKYLDENKIRFYPILQGKSMEETARDYDEALRYLFNYFPKSIGILGVGVDGHTAGIPAIEKISKKILNDKSSLVSFYDDKESFYKQRITLTFLALSRLDEIIILVFGKDKKKALQLMFTYSASSGQESIAQIPSRFLATKEINDKITLITDQAVK